MILFYGKIIVLSSMKVTTMTLISMSPKPISRLKQSMMEDVQIDNILVEKKSITQTQKLINGFNQAFDLYAKAFVAPISRTIATKIIVNNC